MSQANIELINANLDHVAAALSAAGIAFQAVSSAEQNCDAGISISDTLSVSVGADGAHVTAQYADGFEFGETRAINDIAALIADIRSAQ